MRRERHYMQGESHMTRGFRILLFLAMLAAAAPAALAQTTMTWTVE